MSPFKRLQQKRQEKKLRKVLEQLAWQRAISDALRNLNRGTDA